MVVWAAIAAAAVVGVLVIVAWARRRAARRRTRLRRLRRARTGPRGSTATMTGAGSRSSSERPPAARPNRRPRWAAATAVQKRAAGTIGDSMKTTVEPLEGNKVKLSVEVDEREFDKALDAAFRKIAREVRIPGFRPGKAPRRLLEARMARRRPARRRCATSLPDVLRPGAARDTTSTPSPRRRSTSPPARRRARSPSTPSSRSGPQVSVAGYQRPAGHRPQPRGHRRGGRRARSTACATSSASCRRSAARAATATTSRIDLKGYRHGETDPRPHRRRLPLRGRQRHGRARARRPAARRQGRRHPQVQRRRCPAATRATTSRSRCSSRR